MKRLFLFIFSIQLLSGCGVHTNNTRAGVVKPKYHHRLYDAKKDKKQKRVKLVRMN